MASQENETFKFSSDFSNELANKGKQIIEFYHVPTGHSVNFKAFLTQFDDTYASEWSSENVFGRMDPIMTFQRTGRQISIGFDVVAGSHLEADDNISRASLLLQMLYPTYEGGGGGATTIKSSPYFKLQFLNLASNAGMDWSTAEESGLLGTISGFTMSPNLDVGFFQDLDGNNLYPKVFNLACTFTVLHQHSLGWVQKTPLESSFPYLNIVEGDQTGFEDADFFAPESQEQAEIKSNDELDTARSDTMLMPVEDFTNAELANIMYGKSNRLHGAGIGKTKSSATPGTTTFQQTYVKKSPQELASRRTGRPPEPDRNARIQARLDAMTPEQRTAREARRGVLFGNK